MVTKVKQKYLKFFLCRLVCGCAAFSRARDAPPLGSAHPRAGASWHRGGHPRTTFSGVARSQLR